MTAVACIIFDARLLACPWCRQPVMVAVRDGGAVTANNRCLPCQREFRVSAAIVKDDLTALRGARPPLVMLSTAQARALADQAAGAA